MCIEVLEHLPRPIDAINELSRLLKPEGYIIITAPFNSLTHQAPYHYYSGYNRYFYQYFLKEYNLNILEITANGNYFEYIAQELRRIPEIVETYSQDNCPSIDKVNKPIDELLGFLTSFSKKDTGSSELLCFGYNVFAQKNVNGK